MIDKSSNYNITDHSSLVRRKLTIDVPPDWMQYFCLYTPPSLHHPSSVPMPCALISFVLREIGRTSFLCRCLPGGIMFIICRPKIVLKIYDHMCYTLHCSIWIETETMNNNADVEISHPHMTASERVVNNWF